MDRGKQLKRLPNATDMKQHLKTVFLTLILPSLICASCSEEETEYFFGIANETRIQNSDAISIMNYAQSHFDMNDFSILAKDDAEAGENARQIFQERLKSINDSVFNAMFHGTDTYSLILISTLLKPEQDIELARKTWPVRP